MRAASSSRRRRFISSSCWASRARRASAGAVSALPPTSWPTVRESSKSRRNSPRAPSAGDGFDAADAGGDGRLAGELDEADLAGGAGVGAAAELGGEVADLDDADAVAVLFAEQCHGVEFVDGLTSMGTSTKVSTLVSASTCWLTMSSIFGEFFFGDAGEVREVEAEAGAVDERSRPA